MIRFLLALIFMASAVSAEAIRIKDLVEFDGVRGNDLVGYGLVVGLNGTGDGIRNAPFTEEIMANLLERLGANVTGEEFRPKNVAAVFVTAALPPFARAGARMIAQSVRIVVTEGLYLLLRHPDWARLRPMYDVAVLMDVPEPVLRQRLTRRWQSYQLTEEEIAWKLDGNDLPNGRFVMAESSTPDYRIEA